MLAPLLIRSSCGVFITDRSRLIADKFTYLHDGPAPEAAIITFAIAIAATTTTVTPVINRFKALEENGNGIRSEGSNGTQPTDGLQMDALRRRTWIPIALLKRLTSA